MSSEGLLSFDGLNLAEAEIEKQPAQCIDIEVFSEACDTMSECELVCHVPVHGPSGYINICG